MDATTSDLSSPPARTSIAQRFNFSASGARRPFFRGYHWAYFFLAFLVVAEFTGAIWVGREVFGEGIAKIFPLSDYRRLMPGWLILPLLWIGVATFRIVRGKIERPTKTLIRLIRFRSDWLARGLLLLLVYPILAKSFGVMKSAIPAARSYYLDPFLISVDRKIFGMDAWQWSFQIFPDWFVFAIDRVYILWFTYVVVCTGFISFTRDIKLQIRSALTFHIAWFAVGVGFAILFSSVGPIFYDSYYNSNHFQDLENVLSAAKEERGLVVLIARDFLLNNIGKPTLGAGISAMPSLHVTMAFFGFLMVWSRPRLIFLKVFTAIFTVLIMIGSIHLGWHYFSDGIVGILLVWAIWLAVGRFVEAVYREPFAGHSRLVAVGHVHA